MNIAGKESLYSTVAPLPHAAASWTLSIRLEMTICTHLIKASWTGVLLNSAFICFSTEIG